MRGMLLWNTFVDYTHLCSQIVQGVIFGLLSTALMLLQFYFSNISTCLSFFKSSDSLDALVALW